MLTLVINKRWLSTLWAGNTEFSAAAAANCVTPLNWFKARWAMVTKGRATTALWTAAHVAVYVSSAVDTRLLVACHG